MYRIGEFAVVAHVSRRTIDYYTQLGLLNPQRSESNYRYYTDEDLARLRLVELYKAERLSLDDIRARLQVVNQKHAPCEAVTEKVHEIYDLIDQLGDRVLELKPFLQQLDEKQLKTLTQSIAVKGTTVLQLLTMLLEGNPFI